MNIVLFEPDEVLLPIPLEDRRTRHIVEVLRFGPGDVFDAGLIDGPRGKATIEGLDAKGMRLRFAAVEQPPPLYPVTLILGLPRPQTARKVLEEATAMGVAALRFVTADRGDPGYGRSKLWTTGEWRRHLVAGAEQAFTTRLPLVKCGEALADVLHDLDLVGTRLALDNYEGSDRLSQSSLTAPVVLAVGPERGWSPRERGLLSESGFELAHLGERVLRVETACVASLALIKAKLALM